jgi:hypothetical protein
MSVTNVTNLTSPVDVKLLNGDVLMGKMDLSGAEFPTIFALLSGGKIYLLRMDAVQWIRTAG